MADNKANPDMSVLVGLCFRFGFDDVLREQTAAGEVTEQEEEVLKAWGILEP